MQAEEIKQLLSEKYEQIEYNQVEEDVEYDFIKVITFHGVLYFRKKKQWPRVFEDDSRAVHVEKDGDIIVVNKTTESTIAFRFSIQVLHDAVELSKKIRESQS